jgi:hypothetical protein
VVRTLGQIFGRSFVAGWFLWLFRLVLDLLRYRWLELEECYPLRNTYCMSAQ